MSLACSEQTCSCWAFSPLRSSPVPLVSGLPMLLIQGLLDPDPASWGEQNGASWAIELHTVVKKALKPTALGTNYYTYICLYVYRDTLFSCWFVSFPLRVWVPYFALWSFVDSIWKWWAAAGFRRNGVDRGNLRFIPNSATQQLTACWP